MPSTQSYMHVGNITHTPCPAAASNPDGRVYLNNARLACVEAAEITTANCGTDGRIIEHSMIQSSVLGVKTKTTAHVVTLENTDEREEEEREREKRRHSSPG